MNLNRRILLIGGGAFLVILLLWYFVLWAPRSKAINAAKARQRSAQSQIFDLQAQINRLKAQQQQEPIQRAQLERLRTAIPDDPGLAQFILDVNDAATKAGIDFVSVAPALPAAGTAGPGTPAPSGGAAAAPSQLPAQVTVNLQITGGYFQVLDFVNRLTGLPRLVVIDTVNISADAQAKLTVGLTSRMFLRSIPPGFGGAATGGAAGGTAGATTTTTPGGGGGGSTTTTAAGGGRAGTTASTSATTSTTRVGP